MHALRWILSVGAGLGLWVGAAAAPSAARVEPAPAFSVRIVELGGPPGRDDVRRHLEFSVAAGFNAIWVPSEHAGQWTAESTPGGPVLLDEFRRLVDWCRARQVRIFVALNPTRDSEDLFLFGRPQALERIESFKRLLREEAGVRDFVLSFRGSPLRLHELGELLRYGRSAAAAHLDLAARLGARVGRGEHLWLEPSVSNDRQLDDPQIRYSLALQQGLRQLTPQIGLVWTGREPVSQSIGVADLEASQARLGRRPLLLRDPFPANQFAGRMPLSLVLGPPRHRDPGLAGRVAGYLACPMEALGGSRLSLLCTAELLKAPQTYDPERCVAAAIERLAGDRPAALKALQTQVLEWGGWVGERNYHTARSDNPQSAAVALRDPAAVAAWSWVARRYPQRMRALGALEDEAFRDDLLEAMARRLAIARAVPLVRELRARRAAGRSDLDELVRQLRRARDTAGPPSARVALDRFLAAAGAAGPVLGHDGPLR